MITTLPRDAIARYATKFHEALGPVHSAASPLGAWILLALVAPLSTGSEREELEQVLGLPIDEACTYAKRLVATHHPAVASAVALWFAPYAQVEEIGAWLDTMPRAVARGPIPTPEECDAWARRVTLGMIETMPVAPVPGSAFLLATALATQFKWRVPFEVASGANLGGWDLKNVLGSWRGHSLLYQTPSAGLVAALTVESRSDMTVTAVIAGPEVSHNRVMAAAHEIGAGTREVRRVSLFDLPLGKGHAWKIEEETIEVASPQDRVESSRVLLPAWTANAPAVDLMQDAAFGFRAAARALLDRMPPRPDPYLVDAVQATVADYDRQGFRAASITQMREVGAARWGGREHTHSCVHRHAEVRFKRPFAVVAYADADGMSPWLGLPVFSAWVTEPKEADTKDAEYEDFRGERRT
jgi:hypothetical protein